MNETEKMRAARHELEFLSASDPAAYANMVRYVVAYSKLLTGAMPDQVGSKSPVVMAGFRLAGGDEALLAKAVRNERRDCIYIAFDVDDAQGAPAAMGIFRREGDQIICYGCCKVWSPVQGHALLVPTVGDDAVGYFAFRRSGPPRWVDGQVPGSFGAGLLRTQTRLQDLLDEARRAEVHLRGDATVYSSERGELVGRPLKRAA